MAQPKRRFNHTINIRPNYSEMQKMNNRLDKLDKRATITIGNTTFNCHVNDLEKVGDLGKGSYGYVEKCRHTKTNTIMAVKRMALTFNSVEQKRILMDMDIAMRSVDCPYTVCFYGALFTEGDVLICMEVMDASLDKFYQQVFEIGRSVPEEVLGKIMVAVIKALHYLHSELKVIHRDVKPSNILINRKGEVKLCDFGISGHLVNSRAYTIDAGCKPYMAPERIAGNGDYYNISSDVWSLGISMIEIATGKFPYNSWESVFQQINEVVMGDPPKLPSKNFSKKFVKLIEKCLNKDCSKRPNYLELLANEFIKEHAEKETNLDAFVQEILDFKK